MIYHRLFFVYCSLLTLVNRFSDLRTMSCPFLTRLSANYVRNYGLSLIMNYRQYCPIMSRLFNTIPESEDPENGKKSQPTSESVQNRCPFLSRERDAIKQASPAIEEDAINLDVANNEKTSFPYEKFYHEQIIRKKKDHSYKVFKKVNQLIKEFPAKEYSWGEKPIMVWSSNDYLGTSYHSTVNDAIHEALNKFGNGAGGTRNISGNSIGHEMLEKRLALLHQKDSGLLFTTCNVANYCILFTLPKVFSGCQIFSDAGNNTAMMEGIRDSGVPKHIFRRNDATHLEELLSKIDKSVPKIVAFETVQSMTGDICPLEELCDIAHKYGAITFIDEVHAVGLYGHSGAGIGERDWILHKVDIISGTLGNAFGNIGGYVVGSAKLIDTLRSFAAGFIFTTSLPPTAIYGALAAIELLASDEGRLLRSNHQKNVAYLKSILIDAGLPLESSPSHIIPIKVRN